VEAKPRKLVYYRTAGNALPFKKWIRNLGDDTGRAKIQVRLDRAEEGNLGDCGSVGDGVHEIRIHFGPGYRIYFGNDETLIVLLLGGTKATQRGDIETAKKYWEDYNA
jgi:putative addiction module killer protein